MSVRLIMIAMAIFTISFIAYAPALFYDFAHYDDSKYIIDDASIHQLSFENLLQILSNVKNAYWGPTTRISYALDYYFWQLNPMGYHLTNQLLHGLNAVGLYLLLYFIFRLPQINCSHYQSAFVATTTSLIFALHPQNVEAVAWIAGRKDVLSLFLLIPTLFFYLRYTQKNHQYRWYFASLACFTLAIGAKPVVMVLPVVLLILDVYPLYRLPFFSVKKQKYHVTVKRILLEKIPFLLLALIPALLATYAHAKINNLASLEELSLIYRVLSAANITFLYIVHSVIPLGFSVLYPLPVVESLTIWPLLGCLLITILLITRLANAPYLFVSWLLFVIFLFPTLGIVSFNQINAGADRFTYIAAISLYLLISLALLKTHQYFKTKKVLLSITALILIICFTLTRQQIPVWKNSIQLWQHAVAINPKHYFANQSLALAYFNNGHILKAIEFFEKSIVLNEDCIDCFHNITNAYLQIGQKDKALTYLKIIVQKTEHCLTGIESVLYTIALIYEEKKQYQQAQIFVEKALACQAHYQPAQQLQKRLQ